MLVVCFGSKKRSLLRTFKGNFYTQYRKERPSRPSVYSWHKNFVETGCSVHHAKSPGRPCVSDVAEEQLKESSVRSPFGKLVFQTLVCGECYENVYT
jgi:hypothetical protein